MRKPGWAKDLLRSKSVDDVPDQITIIKQGSSGLPQPLGATQATQTRATGTGNDGVLQPMKYAGDVHEGEMVLSANATQALPPDVMQALSQQAENGTVDVNALRTALKIAPQQGYYTGSFGSPIRTNPTAPTGTTPGNKVNPVNPSTPVLPDPLTPNKSTNFLVNPVIAPSNPSVLPTSNNIPLRPLNLNVLQPPTPALTGTAAVRTMPTETPATTTQNAVQPIPVQQTQAPAVRVMPTETSGQQVQNAVQPIETPSSQVVPARTMPADQIPATETVPAGQPVVNNIPSTIPNTDVTPPVTPVTPTQTPNAGTYQGAFQTNLNRVQDIAAGTSEADRNIANQAIRRYDTTAALDVNAAKQQATMQNNIPDTARAALGAEAESAARSGRSDLIGGLASASQERAGAAAQTAASLAMQGMQQQEGVRQFDATFDENVRQFGLNFALNKWATEKGISLQEAAFEWDKKTYGDSQNWKALEAAMLTGSDADVIARYKDATGKDLDPAAVSTYRGYARTLAEQQITTGGLGIQNAMLELANLRSTTAGSDFAAYVQNNPNANPATDPVLNGMAQKLWETNGGTGPVPAEWAAARVKAVRDAGNAIVTFNNDIDYAITSGAMTPEEGAMLKDINSKGILQFYKRDANGNLVFDFEAMAKAMGTTPAGGTTGGTQGITTTGGTATINGKSITTPPDKEPGDIFEREGVTYRVDSDGNPEPVVKKDLKWDDIAGQGLGTDSTAYKAVLNNTPPLDLQYKSNVLTDSWKIAPEEGQVVKTKIDGQDVLLKCTLKSTQDVKYGFDNAYIEFEDMNGEKYYAGGPNKDGTIRKGTARGTTQGITVSNVVAPLIGADTKNPVLETVLNTFVPGRNILSVARKIKNLF
jgi:hypothetical protein